MGNRIISGILWFIAWTPFFLLYRLSDIMWFFVYVVFRYRRKVVAENLKNSFPEKSEKERRKIARRFYRNLCDVAVEIIKNRHICRSQLLKRIQYENLEILDQLHAQNRSAFGICSHCGNWEWLAMNLDLHVKHEVYAVVKPLSSDYFEHYMNHKLRGHFTQDRTIPFKQTLRALVKNSKKLTITMLASDQTPARDEIEYYTTFLNQDTAVFLGAEKMAVKMNLPLVFFDVQRIRRGRYHCTLSIIVDQPKDTKEFEVTNAHVRKLEECIRAHPDNWMWSHKRWKHKRVIG
ncbi:MAG: lysophospholipid acyltransferase family protein [Bacteroidota bacterium]